MQVNVMPVSLRIAVGFMIFDLLTNFYDLSRPEYRIVRVDPDFG
jgi:hypothetical protein